MSFGIYTYDLGGSNDAISKCLIQSDGKIILIGTAFGNFTAIKLSGFGVLDKNFGTNGVATTDFGGNDIALSGSIQQDGKLLIAGSSSWGTPSSDLALVRLLVNGNTDTSFGVNGKVSIDFAQYDTADSISLQPDGRIFIGGHSYYKNNDDFIGVRLNTNGSLDSTFGFGGLTNTDLGSGDFGYSTLVLTDKSLLIAGRSGGAFAVVKYLSNGQLDSTFGQSGKSVLGYFGASDAVKIAISPTDGKIYVAGDTLAGVNRDFAILRLNANGSIDTSFGSQGRTTYDFNGRNDYLSDVLVTTEGKVILTGSSSGDFSALRINSDGNLDLSFGTNGQLVTDVGGINDTSYAAALQSDGKLVIAGSSNGNFAVVRYNTNGALDQTFGNLPTYVLKTNNSTIDEGQIVTVTLTTQYLDAGTSVPYTLSGVSAADVSDGSLSGNAVVNSSGVATISVTLLNDSLTEGTETLTVTAGGASASSQINDTSQTPSAFIQQVNVENANTYWSYWYVNPNNWSNWGSPRITLTSTLTGNTPLQITAAGSINTDPYAHADGQLHPGITNAAGIYVAGSSNGNNPGTTTRVPLNLPNGTLLNTSASWGALLIGNPEIGWTSVFNANLGNGLGSTNPPTNLSISTSLNTLIGRTLPLGTVLFLTYNDQDNSNTGSYTVSLLDTTNNSTVSLVSSSASVDEGSSVTFTLSTTNLASGTSVPYTLSGISGADISGGSLSGNAIINASGVATVSVTLLNDLLTEGQETLTITAGGATASTVINDTSKSTASYALSAGSTSVDEGSSVTFTLSTTNLASGTSVPYTLSGISGADISGGSLSGNAIINASGVATVSVTLLNDLLTEGQETLTITAGGATASTVINDTSKSTASYALSAGSTSVDEGSSVTFTLSTTNLASGTSVPYTLSGISGADISGGSLSGNAIINASGVATVSVTLLNDLLTEGQETLTITAGGATASTVINDTSKSTASYALSAGSTSVDEGSSVTFTLSTTNLASGTSVPYTLSGISGADISGGSLSGNAIINASGVATVSVTLLNDLLTEGQETLTITAGGATASTVINDTSKSTASYALSAGSTSVDEGSSVTFTLSTTNLASGTSVPYTLSGISGADISGGSLSGNAIINASGVATVSVTLLNDLLTEGQETLTITAGGATASTVINDTSKSTASYALSAGSTSVDEGSSVTFTLSTTNLASGTSVPYTLSGISGADISGGSLSGNAIINASGVATVSVTLLNDLLTEGQETLTITAGGATASTVINDTSKSTASYALSAGSTSVDEGSSVTFTLSTTNLASGTSVPYTLSGISGADISGGSLSGNAIINASGVATVSVTLLNDLLTEGQETLTITAGGATASTVINDTSKSTASYALSAGSTSVDEGSSVTFTLSTTNLASGTSVPYTLSGISGADISGGSLSGNAIINASGVATVSVTLLNDLLTEGQETLTITAGGATASTVINDTSKSTASYALSAGSTSVDEGSSVTFTLSTTNLASGTSVPYTLSGISGADISGGSLSGNAIINASGVATVSVTLLNDLLTEGQETLTITAGGATASTVINDTSKSTASYALSAGSTSVDEGSSVTFTLSTTNLASGTSVPYTLSGISGADISGGSLSGNAIINASGVATVSVTLLNDLLTEGQETLTITAGGATASTVINDTSKSTASYALSAGSTSVDEGSSVTFTLSTTNLASGTSVPYTLSGISGADISGGSLSGNAIINASGVATVSVTLLNDLLTEGQETLTITAGGATASTVINDTSKSTASYALSAGSTSVDEGSSVTFTLSTTNLASGTSVPYTLSGISGADISGGSLSGNAIINASGVATVSVTLLNDLLTEGQETLTITAGGATASTVINDTSKSTASYALSAGSTSVDEGSSVTFTLSTTNLASGTSVPYTLSGISGADISGGSLSGNAIINASGVATVSVTLLNDLLTEGQETLTITAGGATASTVINDTSKSTASYALSAGSTSVDEGSSVTFTLSTTNLASGTSVPYTLSGISGADISGGSLSGNAIINASGVATVSVTLLNDLLTEGQETLTITAGGATASTVINDTSKSTASYALSAGSTSVDEGSSVTFTLSTTNLASGTSVPYTLSGISGADISGGSLSGNAIINASGVATVSVTLLNDLLTEGQETLTITAGGATASTVINDTSKSTASYALSAGSTSVDEGSSVTFTLSTTNLASGTSVPYTLSGISGADISGGSLSGNAIINASGVATVSVTLLNDLLTEGQETLTITAGGATASTVINDTSKSTASYALSAGSTSVDEGSSVTFTLSTTNLASGTSVPYTLSGISGADISGGSLSGNAIINASGVATVSVTLLNDLLTEGQETLTITAGGATASTVINDTSKSTASYALSAGSTSVDEGSSVTFTLSTTNLASGTSVPYTLSGISGADISGGSLSGNAIINASGVATVSVTLLNDLLTEGQETLTITAGGATASTVINDTSKSTASYALSAGSTSVDEGSSVTFTLSTTNLASGTSVPYTLSGISGADISGGSLSGNAIINASGVATVSVTLLNDLLTEGQETLTITAGGATASTVINDTSKSVATTWINAGRTSANEGEFVSFVLLIIGVPAETSVPYTLSGISSADIAGGKLEGNAVINSAGLATISVNLLNDSLTEGTETLTISAGGASALIEVMDTSTSKKTALENHNLSVVVDKGVLGVTATLLKNLIETIVFVNGVMTKHTIQYSGNTFDYDSIDHLITTVTRDGEFTSEFTKEINDYLGAEQNITYSAAVAIVGAASIDGIILSVAGADGNFVA